MNRRTSLALGTTALLSLGMAFSGAAFAQQKSLKEQLVGSWIVVSVDNTAPDGKKSQTFGPNPKGMLIFGTNGHYSQTIVDPGVPKFKINNRLKGTPEENAAAVHGTTTSFGTWTVDEASKTITVRNVGGMFPNQAGTDSPRTVTSITADELKLSTPVTATGLRSDNVWKRSQTVASR